MVIIIASLVIYFIAYMQRIKGVLIFDNIILDYIVGQLALLGTSVFPYIIGSIFAYRKIYSKIYILVNKLKYKNIIITPTNILFIIAHYNFLIKFLFPQYY